MKKDSARFENFFQNSSDRLHVCSVHRTFLNYFDYFFKKTRNFCLKQVWCEYIIVYYFLAKEIIMKKSELVVKSTEELEKTVAEDLSKKDDNEQFKKAIGEADDVDRGTDGDDQQDIQVLI